MSMLWYWFVKWEEIHKAYVFNIIPNYYYAGNSSYFIVNIFKYGKYKILSTGE